MKTDIREPNEWITMRWIDEQESISSGLPRLLHVGDSIANGMSTFLAAQLKGAFGVDLFATSKIVCDKDYESDLALMFSKHEYDVIIFNNGLHGEDVADQLYAAGLMDVLSWLMEKTGTLYWRSSTPCFGDSSWKERIVDRNRLAQQAAAQLDLPVIDCYEVLKDREDLSTDNIHFHNEGYEILARQISSAIDCSAVFG